MTVYDLIQMYANKSEEEQKQSFVYSIWDIEDVDAVLDVMGYDDDCLGNNDKIACLAQAVEDGDTDDEIRDCLWNNLQKVLDGSMEDDDEPDPDEYDEGHAKEWMERHPYGWYNSESDYGTGDEDEEQENGIEGDDDLQK